ncbi:hypothetical protein CEXT_168211 [Caerostris extrusa]|uniref:Uncharacterized protein n=1 Tax=Caerostris extrusa TaxID=172846 RepID=A0AAV4Q7P7_CAEEX|nr:hypothetical protein CEXT_168211 [Caerostris extrusa]
MTKSLSGNTVFLLRTKGKEEITCFHPGEALPSGISGANGNLSTLEGFQLFCRNHSKSRWGYELDSCAQEMQDFAFVVVWRGSNVSSCKNVGVVCCVPDQNTVFSFIFQRTNNAGFAVKLMGKKKRV